MNRVADPRCRPPPPRRAVRRAGRATAAAVAIAALTLLASLLGGVGATSSAPDASHGSQLAGAHPTGSVAAYAPSPSISTGNGSFWLNTPLPNVSSDNSICLVSPFGFGGPECGPTNITNEPSINLSSRGVLVTAYTAYTNSTPCDVAYPLLRSSTYTQIGISTSTDGGGRWSAPQYLGNTNCTATSEATAANAGEEGAVFVPQTGEWFVTNYAAGTVEVISPTTGALVQTIGVGTRPDAITSDSSMFSFSNDVYVANYGSDNVTMIDPYCLCVSGSVPVGSEPDGIVTDSDSGSIFVTNYGSDNVSVISGFNNTDYASIAVGSEPTGIADEPDYQELFVSNHGSGNVSVIGAYSLLVSATVSVGAGPEGVAYDGANAMYVANNGSDNVSVIAVGNDTVIADPAVGLGPDGVAYDGVLGTVLVTNYASDNVSEISPASDRVTGSFGAGTGPAAVAYGQFDLLVANSGSHNLSLTSAASANEYLNDWQPTVTSLANGTLVVAWIEFNESTTFGCQPFGCFGSQFPDLSVGDYGGSQLVVSFSYDDGAIWTDPTPLNTSPVYGATCDGCRTSSAWIQQRPSITAIGQTIYLAWTNITEGWDQYYPGNGNLQMCEQFAFFAFGCPQGGAGVQLSVSPSGTSKFNPPVELPVRTAPGTANASLDVAANPSVLVTPNGTVVVAYMTNVSFNGSLGDQGYPCTYEPLQQDTNCGGFVSSVLVAHSGNNGSTWSIGVAADGVYDARDYQSGYDPQDQWAPDDRGLPAPVATYDPASQQVIVAYLGDLSFHACVSLLGGCRSYYLNEFSTSEVYVAHGSLVNNTWSTGLVSSWSGLGNSTINGQIDSYLYNPAIASTANGTIYLTVQFVNGSACSYVPAGSYAFYTAIDYCGEGLELFGISTDSGSSFSPPGDLESTGTWYSEMPSGLAASMVVAGNQVWIAWTQTTCPGWNGPNETRCNWQGNLFFGRTGGFTSNTTVVVSRLYLGTGVQVSFAETGLPAGASWSVDLSGNSRTGLAGSTLSVGDVPTGAEQTWNASIVSWGPGGRYIGSPSLPSPGNFSANTTISWTFTLQYTLTISSIPGYPGGSSGGYVWFDGGEYCSGSNSEYIFDPAASPCSYTQATSINYNMTPGLGTIWANAGTPFQIQAIPLNGSEYWQEYSCIGCDWNYVNLTFEAWTGTGAGSYNGTSNSTTITLNGPVTETASYGINAYCSWTLSPTWTSNCAPSGLTVFFKETGLPAGDPWGVSVWGAGPNQTTPFPAFTNQSTLSVEDPVLTSVAYFQSYTIPSSTPGEVWAATEDPVSPLLGPIDGSSTLHYSLTAVATAVFPSTIQAVGLPNGTAWSFSLNGVGFGVNGSIDNLTVPGGSRALTADPVYFSNGTGYAPHAIDIDPFVLNETWANATSGSATYTFNGSASIRIYYTPVYELTNIASAGGSVTDAGTSWQAPNQKVPLLATADPGYYFVGWTGSGVGSTTNTGSHPPTEINVTLPDGPVSELATFAPNGTAMYVLTVTATGLLAGGTYGVTFNGTTYYGNGTFDLPAYLGGNYTISAPIAYDNSDSLIRFLPIALTTTGLSAGPGGTYDLDSNGGTIDVGFDTQYALVVSESGPGSTEPAPGIYWETSGNQTMLTATAAAGNVFARWTGTGTGSENSTLPSFTLTISGPSAEAAEFTTYVPTPSTTFTLTVTESGLPKGATWWLSDGVTGAGSTTTTVSLSGLNGTYLLTVPAVRLGTGEQYVSNLTGTSEVITSNQTMTVAFTGEYLLTVFVGAGGSSTPGTEWVDAGSNVTLTATSDAGYHFVSWNGSGLGSYTGTSPSGTVTIGGAVTETAEFAANAPTSAVTVTTSPGLPSYLPWLALVALFVAGFAAVYLIGRAGRAGPPPPLTTGTEDGAEPGELPAWSGAPGSAPAEYDETDSTGTR
jgi:YVTN family beta-propeller protein